MGSIIKYLMQQGKKMQPYNGKFSYRFVCTVRSSSVMIMCHAQQDEAIGHVTTLANGGVASLTADDTQPHDCIADPGLVPVCVHQLLTVVSKRGCCAVDVTPRATWRTQP